MAPEDPIVERLATLFRSHPAWLEAARPIREGARSRVFFRHRPGEEWTLVRRGGESLLLAEPCRDPDFVFGFPASAVERLEACRGGVGDFAVTLFELMLAEDDDERVDFRIAASFRRLVRNGYVRLLASSGPRVLRFGAARGVGNLGALRRLVAQLRSRAPFAFEAEPRVRTRPPADPPP